ncbi:HlyD family efflux transporter periplasmic adaptor subunit [Bradyrhizobium sp. 83012]|uniref:HlyD family efflux transporter periplasmic adaptor subunit n=2 Tax=Bradyrhizobium aeschynomenes TaxID=2734909 RepID=A0ABX2CQK3_9BRAD|nr:HlyD family efflux transporter periplasmic adaptor subunit [Bradyrhizobium aeschynomenes]NPU69699.1 HlyD family efflux transporter periplasmic adaptor subunit [Bradyrhizobium aeschynomenes]NPV24640.1 HlyD family efflux transporter periplasmic adaptor subunit [Bradyrhizobium aeschynomenes]
MFNIVSQDQLAQCTAESILARGGGGSYAVYNALLILVAVSIAALPLTTVTVSIQSNGFVRPAKEKAALIAPVAGRISRIFVAENQIVRKDQEIISIEDQILRAKIEAVEEELREKRDLVHDLESLIGSIEMTPRGEVQTVTSAAGASQLKFQEGLREIEYAQDVAAKELDRARKLLSTSAVAAKVVEEREAAFRSVEVKGGILLRSQSAEWNQQLLETKLRVKELEVNRQQLALDQELTKIRAPEGGAIEGLLSWATGGYVQSGQTIAQVSPDGDLVAEIYVSPRDIGFVYPGQLVRLQIDAFNYNQWGSISATVIDVAQDFTVHDQREVFKVRCAPSVDHLQLKNGLIGRLRKGMSVRASFLVSDCTLLDLLIGEIDNWLNPVRSTR